MNKLLLAFCFVAVCAASTNFEQEDGFLKSFNIKINAAASRVTRNAIKASKSVKKAPRGFGLKRYRKSLKKSVLKCRKAPKCGIPKRGFLEEDRFFGSRISSVIRRAAAKAKADKAKRAAAKARRDAAAKKFKARFLKFLKKHPAHASALAKKVEKMQRARKQAAAVRQAKRRACRVAFWKKIFAASKRAKASRRAKDRAAAAKAGKFARAKYAKAVKKLRAAIKRVGRTLRRKARKGSKKTAKAAKRVGRHFKRHAAIKRVGRTLRRKARKGSKKTAKAAKRVGRHFRKWGKRVGRTLRRKARKGSKKTAKAAKRVGRHFRKWG